MSTPSESCPVGPIGDATAFGPTMHRASALLSQGVRRRHPFDVDPGRVRMRKRVVETQHAQQG